VMVLIKIGFQLEMNVNVRVGGIDDKGSIIMQNKNGWAKGFRLYDFCDVVFLMA
jgi:hypothetical protein